MSTKPPISFFEHARQILGDEKYEISRKISQEFRRRLHETDDPDALWESIYNEMMPESLRNKETPQI